MKKTASGFRLSATDLANHLACGHLTNLDIRASQGKLTQPDWENPSLAVLQQRGIEHEKSFVAHLKSHGLTVDDHTEIESPKLAREKTIESMHKGTDIIVQAALGDDSWFGKADILKKVATKSKLGNWSYEAMDTKLSKETKSGAILQLCLYSECLAEIQGLIPEYLHVVPPGEGFVPNSFRVLDYLAYYRFVKSRILKNIQTTVSKDGIDTYPEPVDHCEVCRWWKVCDEQRRKDDHLSIVAGLSKLQTREFEKHDIKTVEKLAAHPIPFLEKFNRGTPEGFVRVREQARVQFASRKEKKPIYELLPVEDGRGFQLLPQPSKGDLFFDIEGDPFVGTSGMEYLFGLIDISDGSAKYLEKWAFSYDEERQMFEWLIDLFMDRWTKSPDFHIYHYAHYEPTALKRLMGRYGAKENEVDRLLRAGKFVDLYAAAKQSLRASVESYSIKELEKFYGYVREVPLMEASKQRHSIEHALELGRANDIAPEIKQVVQKYNQDDCLSTLALRDWLETLRTQLVKQGTDIPRPTAEDGNPSEAVSEQDRIINELKARLTDGMPGVPESRSKEQQSIWVLAEMLAWHRRESKAPWWEFFRLQELSDEELLEERGGISGLRYSSRVGGTARCPIDRYEFPAQEVNIRAGESLYIRGGDPIGSVEEIDLEHRTIDIKKRTGMGDNHPSSIFEHNVVNSKVLSDALFRIGQWVASNGIDANGSYRAGRDLLLKYPPRLSGGPFLIDENVTLLESARSLSTSLDNGVLAIQGPPGAGKTFTAAEMICELISSGKKVGITAVSHKVIRNLLEKVAEALGNKDINGRVIHKVSEASEENESDVEEITDNGEALSALESGGGVVVGGTAWLWTREDASESLDVLFVDEAGQMSLANVVAVSQAGGSLVLLGDPQQLDQPMQGSHPEGTSVSALEHLLDGRKTIPKEMGLFLAETWRLHPAICSFTSELFYENRLTSRDGLERQSINGNSPFKGAGLWVSPVYHEGNQNSSPEEIEEIKKVVKALTQKDSVWTDKEGKNHQIGLEDILIVAPYNAQVFKIADVIPGARVGTVDKFQGQEAPVVIYSMSTSTHDEAPRGMEFLYSLNRFNVATSRAKCCCILVANPKLFEPNCRSPRQIQLVNAFCRYLELAKETPTLK